MELTRREREKKNRENEIIHAATKVFAKHGYEQASMNEIAKEAQFTKRTLYKYFVDKSELYLAVALRIYSRMLQTLLNISSDKNTGFNSIKEILISYFNFYKTNKQNLKIINAIGEVRKQSTSQKILEFLAIDQQIFTRLQDLILKGQNDGSIAKEVEPLQTTYTLIFLMTGFLNQLTETGENFTKHININIDEFIDGVVEYLIRPLSVIDRK